MKQVTRFFKDRVYVGIHEHTRDCFRNWRNIREVVTFTGKPYSVAEYDAVYEFTGPEQLRALVPDSVFRSVQRCNTETIEAILARGEHVISCLPVEWA